MSESKLTIDAIADYFLNRDDPSDDPPQPPEGEPTYAEYEAHVTGKKPFSPDVLRRVNVTPAWQLKLRLFRKHAGPQWGPLAEEVFVWIKRRLTPNGLLLQAQPLLAGTAAVEYPEYPAVVLDEQARLVDEGRIQIVQGPKYGEGQLILRLRVLSPDFPDEFRPIRLALVSVSTGEEICDLELPGSEELLKVNIPSRFVEKGAWDRIGPDWVPFGFVIRRGPASTLLAA